MMISPFTKFSLFAAVLFACNFLWLLACNSTNQSDEETLIEIVEQFKADENHVYLRNFIPTLEDCRAVFTEEAAQKVFDYSESRFASLDQLPGDAMKPVSEGPSLKIQSATKEGLLAGKANDLEEGYLGMAEYLKDGVSVYGFHYVNANAEVEKSRAAFFKAGDKWIFIPRAFLAFE